MTDKAESAPRSCKPFRDCYQKTTAGRCDPHPPGRKPDTVTCRIPTDAAPLSKAPHHARRDLGPSSSGLRPTNRHDRRRHRTTGHSERRGTPHSHRGTATSESGRSPTCSDAGVVDSLQLSAASQHDDTARLAEALEIWMEAYAAQWSTVSQGSGLRRLQDTVRELTDYLRFQSI